MKRRITVLSVLVSSLVVTLITCPTMAKPPKLADNLIGPKE